MKKSIKILCSTFGLLSVSIPTIVATISCSNGNETKPEKPVEPVEPITYDLAKDLKEEDFTDKNKTVLKIPDEYEKVNIFIGKKNDKDPLNISIDQLKLLENVVQIQLPKNIKYLNIDIPVSSNMSSLSSVEWIKDLDGVMPNFNQLLWTWPDGSVHENDPGNIHLKEFCLFGSATRLYDLIVPYADDYRVYIGPSFEFYDDLNNFIPYGYNEKNPDFRLKNVDLSRCTNLTRTRNSGIRFFFCPYLYSIKFNNILTKIEPGFFNYSNWELTTLDIPKSVETIYLGNLEHTQVQFDFDSNLKELIYTDDGWGNYNQDISKKILESNVKTLDLSHCQNYLSKNLVNFENWFAINYEKYKGDYFFTTNVKDYDWNKIIFPKFYIDKNDNKVPIDDSWKHNFLKAVEEIKNNDKQTNWK